MICLFYSRLQLSIFEYFDSQTHTVVAELQLVTCFSGKCFEIFGERRCENIVKKQMQSIVFSILNGQKKTLNYFFKYFFPSLKLTFYKNALQKWYAQLRK